MPEYTINTDLYNKALKEIFDSYLSKNPIDSELARSAIEKSVREHAVNTFGLLWQNATRLHDNHITFNASQAAPRVADLSMERRIAGLDPGDRALMRNFRQESNEMLAKSMKDRQKVFDDNHRLTLVTLFASPNGCGLNKVTAEKIVDEHILSHT